MRTTEEKLESLTENDVWIFTKQATSFDNAFKAAKLFAEMPNKENGNIEQYFNKNYHRYDISTSNHRMLIISQMFGLITKTPFYSRGNRYTNENPTEMFELLNNCEFGGE